MGQLCPVTCGVCEPEPEDNDEKPCEDQDETVTQLAKSALGMDLEGCGMAVAMLSTMGMDCDTDLTTMGLPGSMGQSCPVTCGECEPEPEDDDEKLCEDQDETVTQLAKSALNMDLAGCGDAV